MSSFGNLIKRVTGSSAGIEMILKRKAAGGFTSNVCKALNAIGLKIYLASAWGYPKSVDVFSSLEKQESIDSISFTDPGITIGLEFNDGKIMLNNIESLLKINCNLIEERVGIQYLIERFEICNLIGLGYWSVILNFKDIFQRIISEMLPSVKNLENKLLFLDLADVKRRTKNDLAEFLKFLPYVDEQVNLLLSLNDQEAKEVLKALAYSKQIKVNNKKLKDLTRIGEEINKILDISYLVVHSPHFATITAKNNHFWVKEGYTSNPRYTTSAGDHFNAGTVLGLSCELTPPEAILMGNALTAIFVRTGNSPNFNALSQFIQKYMEYIEKDNPNFP
jgi:hypothetical protein